jgi:hypothetical protein
VLNKCGVHVTTRLSSVGEVGFFNMRIKAARGTNIRRPIVIDGIEPALIAR